MVISAKHASAGGGRSWERGRLARTELKRSRTKMRARRPRSQEARVRRTRRSRSAPGDVFAKARRAGPRAGKAPGAGGPAPGGREDPGPQCDEARTDEPDGIRVASTMSWVSLSGSAVMRLTTTIATRLTGMPMIPKRRWSMPIHGSMPAKRTM